MEQGSGSQYQLLLIRDLAERQVAAVIAEKWSLLKALVWLLGPLFLALVGLLGLSHYLSVKGQQELLDKAREQVTKQVKEAEESAKTLKDQALQIQGMIKNAEGIVKEAEKMVQSAQATVDTAKAAMTISANSLSESSTMLTTSHMSVAQTHDQISKAANEALQASNDAYKVQKESSRIQQDTFIKEKEFKSQIDKFNKDYQDALEKFKDLTEKSQKIQKIFDEVITNNGGLETLRTVSTTVARASNELLRLKSTETIVLQTEKTVRVWLPDPEKSDLAQFYELMVTADDAGKDMDIRYSMTKPGGRPDDLSVSVRASYRTFKEGKHHQVLPIADSPFEFVVEYMGYGVFINDFIILKIRLRQPNQGMQQTVGGSGGRS